MAPGARSDFGTPIFETEVFGKQMYCVEESTCDCWDFSAPPQWFCAPLVIRRPGNYAPLAPPSYAPAFISLSNSIQHTGALPQLSASCFATRSKLSMYFFAVKLTFDINNPRLTWSCCVLWRGRRLRSSAKNEIVPATMKECIWLVSQLYLEALLVCKFTLQPVNYAENSMLAKPQINFRNVGIPTALRGTLSICLMTKSRCLYCTMWCTNIRLKKA